ncbi:MULTISPECIES: hypothetical protein [Brevibacillus]|uniref:hypothetical protein n=1 Tax=Brevibacillus TaxID=55080 RepID=UPI00148F946F|nr:hypothetical protein [Brevibacillus borstelensis]MCC0563980.1 hypothetical protein [Brevibacillus borstelensis]MCM3473716.1 hypothetical protein [Brevibacillus borstelensis]MCM3558121.1 hypothetical protein [Brevibacillus borstelensis]MCM3593886.1 hypothetical protein [Brevibacillus borstelensis]MCM3621124.1 hypothetical protein [Brevibacillus borstelensis]
MKKMYGILVLIVLLGAVFYLVIPRDNNTTAATPASVEAADSDNVNDEITQRIILQYMDEVDSIFSEIHDVLPAVKLADKKNAEQVNIAKEWLRKNGEVVKDNQIVLSISDDGEGSDHSFLVGAKLYTKQSKTPLSINDVGMERISYGQIILVKEKDKWVVKEFKRKF